MKKKVKMKASQFQKYLGAKIQQQIKRKNLANQRRKKDQIRVMNMFINMNKNRKKICFKNYKRKRRSLMNLESKQCTLLKKYILVRTFMKNKLGALY